MSYSITILPPVSGAAIEINLAVFFLQNGGESCL